MGDGQPLNRQLWHQTQRYSKLRGSSLHPRACPPPSTIVTCLYGGSTLYHDSPVIHLPLSRHDPQFYALLLPTLPTLLRVLYDPQIRLHGDRGGARVHRPFFPRLFFSLSHFPSCQRLISLYMRPVTTIRIASAPTAPVRHLRSPA